MSGCVGDSQSKVALHTLELPNIKSYENFIMTKIYEISAPGSVLIHIWAVTIYWNF